MTHPDDERPTQVRGPQKDFLLALVGRREMKDELFDARSCNLVAGALDLWRRRESKTLRLVALPTGMG